MDKNGLRGNVAALGLSLAEVMRANVFTKERAVETALAQAVGIIGRMADQLEDLQRRIEKLEKERHQ